jgi:hypothetical protein
MDGALLVVGAHYYTAATTKGKAYIFHRVDTTWSQETVLTASDEADLDRFGASVAIMGQIVAVAAPEDDDNSLAASGSVYIFTRDNYTAVWSQQSKVTPTSSQRVAGQKFGGSHHGCLSIAGKRVISGGDDVSYTTEFEAYLFELREIGALIMENEADPIGYVSLDIQIEESRFNGCKLLTSDHHIEQEVTDWGRASSQTDKLRQATLVEHADGQDLTRIGRNHGLDRLRGLSDATFREVVKACAYTFRGTIFAQEMLLEALYPDQDWAIYEDRVNFPCEEFFTIPGQIGDEPLGRTYLNDRDDATSSTTTAVALTLTPTTVESVKLQDIEQELGMAVLPSADTPAWTYVAESAGAEGTYFASTLGVLVQTHPVGINGGRYQRSLPEIGTEYNSLEVGWKAGAITTVGGYPWKIFIQDGAREYAILWNGTTVAIGQSDETIVDSVAVSGILTGWHTFRIVRRDDTIYGYMNGTVILSALASSFAVSAGKLVSFGYTDNGNSNQWTASWDNALVYTRNSKNFWNLTRSDGVLTGSPSVTLASAAALFLSPTDVGSLMWLEAVEDENYGLWDVASVPAPGQVTLTGHLWSKSVYMDVLYPDRIFAYEGRFVSQDAVKDIVLSGSAVGNDDTYPVIEVVSDKELKVDITGHGAGLATELNMAYKWDAVFAAETTIPWTLVACGSNSGVNLTLREALPAANSDVTVDYTTVLSAVLKRNETVARGESYPFYLQGVDERLQALIESLTAAGVIPRFSRGY